MSKILIVEDDPALAGGLEVNLENCGYEIECVSSGMEAIEMIKQLKIDLVLLDINLPDISGFEICQKIKSGRNIPILFLTARDMEIDEVRGFAAGADDYIKKPFSVSWTIVNKKDTIFKYIFWERLDSLPIPECCFHFVWCQIA